MGRPKGSKNKTKLSEDEIEEIIRLYKNEREPLYKLEKLFSLSSLTIKNLLTEHNVEIRNFREAKRMYPLNDMYFNKIDTKDKAYWLGFMFADGFITKGKNGQFIFGMSLHEKEPLELFKKYLNSNKPIGEYVTTQGFNPGSICYKLAISSKQVFDDLIKHGCVENKTFKLIFPNINVELISHFIRGYFDGDGSVYTSYQLDKLHLSSSICGIKSFLESILKNINFIESDKKLLYKDERKESDCHYIKFNSIYDSLQFYHYLYKDCDDLFLKRKKEKFENFILDRGSTTIITNPTNQAFIKLCYLED